VDGSLGIEPSIAANRRTAARSVIDNRDANTRNASTSRWRGDPVIPAEYANRNADRCMGVLLWGEPQSTQPTPCASMWQMREIIDSVNDLPCHTKEP